MLLPGTLLAIPNSILGPVAAADSPFNGKDLTADLIDDALWAGKAELPGKWQEEGRVVETEISHMLARPRLLGQEVVLLRASKRDGRLVTLEATFADAGSFFGYFDEPLPENLSRRAQRAELNRRLARKQAEFSGLYAGQLGAVRSALAGMPGMDRPRDTKVGHTRTLRTVTEDFTKGDLTFRLLASEQRLVRLTVGRDGELPDSWLDPEVSALSERERAARLRELVRKEADGTVTISGLRPLAQGYRPYCGLNSLAMVARHFGLHMDEDWLAAAGGFRNTGSADGSNILRLYPAVASEAGFSMERGSRFDEAGARRALAEGFPVIVWRRFSHERDQVHSRFAREHAKDPGAMLPDPNQPAERATWPDGDAPLHASVLTGYHLGRGEFLFLESWTGKDTPRRMRAGELAATAYLTFVFRP